MRVTWSQSAELEVQQSHWAKLVYVLSESRQEVECAEQVVESAVWHQGTLCSLASLSLLIVASNINGCLCRVILHPCLHKCSSMTDSSYANFLVNSRCRGVVLSTSGFLCLFSTVLCSSLALIIWDTLFGRVVRVQMYDFYWKLCMLPNITFKPTTSKTKIHIKCSVINTHQQEIISKCCK